MQVLYDVLSYEFQSSARITKQTASSVGKFDKGSPVGTVEFINCAALCPTLVYVQGDGVQPSPTVNHLWYKVLLVLNPNPYQIIKKKWGEFLDAV
jgi:hypothetical protein